MNWTASFQRKIIYGVIIAISLVLLSFLGMPATVEEGSGGWLAQKRAEHQLAQVNLGQVDPASEAMKLSTLGLRGIAVNILWNRALEYQKKKDWTNVKATLEQTAMLQPNYPKVWEFQAHNLSYNISAEFDDYRQRYHWVKKGIDYLIEGVQYNRDRTRLLNTLGHYFGQKFGRADEHKYFREMFREDDDFHNSYRHHVNAHQRDALGLDGNPDNWLVGRLWFLKSREAVARGARIEGDSALLFYSKAPKQRINFAVAAEEDGFIGETTRVAWETALRDWGAYGDRPIPSSYGHILHLNDKQATFHEIEELWKRLDALSPGLKEKIFQQRYDALSEAEQEAWETDPRERTEAQWELLSKFYRDMEITADDVAEQVTSDPAKAKALAQRIKDRQRFVDRVDRYRSVVNYEYWKTRCEVEQMPVTIEARRLLYDAGKALDDARLDDADKLYDQAWVKWAEVFEQYPQLLGDVVGEDVMVSIKQYRKFLAQDDRAWPPEDFPLLKLIKAQDWQNEFGLSSDTETPADAKEQ